MIGTVIVAKGVVLKSESPVLLNNFFIFLTNTVGIKNKQKY